MIVLGIIYGFIIHLHPVKERVILLGKVDRVGNTFPDERD